VLFAGLSALLCGGVGGLVLDFEWVSLARLGFRFSLC
jgi:hypothetical protein